SCMCTHHHLPSCFSPLCLHDALPISRFSSSAESTQGRSHRLGVVDDGDDIGMAEQEPAQPVDRMDQETDAHAGVTGVEVFTLDQDRKSTRLNSSHVSISYAVFCLQKK